MSQNEAKQNQQWIQLKKKIGPSDWNYKEVVHSNTKESGFHTKIEFEPKLSNETYIQEYKCNYYEKTISLEVFISVSDDKNNVGLRLCYIPMSTSKKDHCLQNSKPWADLIRNTTNPHCLHWFKSYVWTFDICLVKMIFINENDNTNFITENFHMEFGIGNCKHDDHAAASRDELSHVTTSELFSVADLESKIGYFREKGKRSFVPLEIEFRARLHLRPVLQQNFQILEADNKCVLDISGMELLQSENLAVSSLNPFLPNVGSKFIVSDLVSDIHFELLSELSKVLRAHSFILAAQSPVFRQMLSADMLEKKTGVIKLKDDTTADSLKLFLTYLYGRMCLSYSENADESPKCKSIQEWTVELSLEILKLAHKYQVTDLTDFCIENIISRPDSEISTQLTVQIFKAGTLYGNDDLRTRSVEWATRQTKEAKLELLELLKEESKTDLLDLIRIMFN